MNDIITYNLDGMLSVFHRSPQKAVIVRKSLEQLFVQATRSRPPSITLPQRQQQQRLLSSKHVVSRQRARKREEKKKAMTEQSVETHPAAPPAAASRSPADRWRTLVLRYRKTGSTYTREQILSALQRLPLWIILVGLLTWEETSPLGLLSIRGPSMLPTLSADGSDVWLQLRKGHGRWWNGLVGGGGYRVGDLVGMAHPDDPHHIACKRVIGIVGDVVPRYGQSVHLYTQQDPEFWGIHWPLHNHPIYKWIDRNWDQKYGVRDNNREDESRMTLVVPEGHVWLEGDCPALSIDSRHYGPVPIEWLQGKLVARLWPLWRWSGPELLPRHKRPHPIPLDDETLRQYNVHKVVKD